MFSTMTRGRASSRATESPSHYPFDELPADFDPADHPIISHHFFGLRPIGEVAAEVVSSLRRQRAAEHLHNLGPRPVLEALAEVEAGSDLDRVLADFERIDAETVRQLGGDKVWPAPLREVRRVS